MEWVKKTLAEDFFLFLSNHTLMLLSRPADLFHFLLLRKNARV